MNINLYFNPLTGLPVESYEEAFWVFARHVTVQTMQVTDFAEIYEERRNLHFGEKKLTFRGVGLDKEDNPVIRVINKKGESSLLTVDELSEKEKKRLYFELETLAEMFKFDKILLCTSIYKEPNSDYMIIDVVFKLDLGPDARINFLANARSTKDILYAKGMTILFNGKHYIIESFYEEIFTYSVKAYRKGTTPKESQKIDLLLLEPKELDKIISRISKKKKETFKEALKRPNVKYQKIKKNAQV